MAGGLDLLASESLARAAGYQEDHRAQASGGPIAKSLAESVAKGGEYSLPPLPYAYEALEPSIDAETMRLHHDKHQAAYVKGANEASAKLAEVREGKLDPALISDLTEKLTFNLSGHLLHATFWAVMGPKGVEPKGALASDIGKYFGSHAKHAYYLKYRNVRADYVKAFWDVVNWTAVDEWYAFIKRTHHESSQQQHGH